jgi:hypothetical protein
VLDIVTEKAVNTPKVKEVLIIESMIKAVEKIASAAKDGINI